MNNKGRTKSAPPRRTTRHTVELDIPQVSLMWPDARRETPKPTAGATWEADLGLSDLVEALARNSRYSVYVRHTLAALNGDLNVIRWRQAVLGDFLRNPTLVATAQQLLPQLASLQGGNALLGKRQRNLLLDTADHLGELESFTQVVQTLQSALTDCQLESIALQLLRDRIGELATNPDFQALQAELPELRAPLERVRSLTVGINLDLELRPESAALLNINDYKVGIAASWLERVMGIRGTETEEPGITALHHTPEDPNHRILSPLFQDLDHLLTQVAQPIAKTLSRYARSGSGALAHLEYELAFFTAAARLFRRLEENGIIVCQPESAPTADRSMNIEGLVNIALALRHKEAPVGSDVSFGAEGRIAVLTGPNSGGKTTFLRSVGLAQVMFQAGLFIPAGQACLSPVDTILTHFPALETRQDGRLAEEAVRLREIFKRATAQSLVLLNETFSSTSAGEAVYLAQDILCGLRALGIRAIYATHLIELAHQLESIESTIAGDSRLFSLVAGVQIDEDGQTVPTYVISTGLPLGQSYAREIARRHGISLDQLLSKR